MVQLEWNTARREREAQQAAQDAERQRREREAQERAEWIRAQVPGLRRGLELAQGNLRRAMEAEDAAARALQAADEAYQVAAFRETGGEAPEPLPGTVLIGIDFPANDVGGQHIADAVLPGRYQYRALQKAREAHLEASTRVQRIQAGIGEIEARLDVATRT